ncbi:MAG: hypothetical protein Q7S66_05645 [bacterium]|nr:hypothetical protein [bacterium]
MKKTNNSKKKKSQARSRDIVSIQSFWQKFFGFLNSHSLAIQAIASIVIAIFTVVNFLSWRTSVKILEQEKSAALAQNRPYISISNDSDIKSDGDNYIFNLPFKNEGKTPASLLSFTASSYLSGQFTIIANPQEAGVKSYLAPNQSQTAFFTVKKETFEQLKNNQSNYLSIEIAYRDYLKNTCALVSNLYLKVEDQRYQLNVGDQKEGC